MFSFAMMDYAVALRSKGVAYQTIFDVFVAKYSSNVKDAIYPQFMDAVRQYAAVPHLLSHEQFGRFGRDQEVCKGFPNPECPACLGGSARPVGPVIAVGAF